MNNIVEMIFNEIKKEARTCEIKYNEMLFGTIYECVFRMGFNVVENNNVSDSLFNFYIKDYDAFIGKLQEYIYCASNLYDVNLTGDVIKKLLILLWANITNEEMLNIDDYVQKYIDFINNNEFVSLFGKKEIDELGFLNFSFNKQSYKQETPYCFNSYFNDIINGQEVIYHLPRISYGLKDNKCYIYAVQNKQKNGIGLNQEIYSELVKKKMNTLNSGVKRYRNVSPSALTVLILFLSILKSNGINNYEIVCNLPIRHQNRKLVNDFKLQVDLSSKSIEECEKIKQIMLNDDIRIRDNTILKFQNNFRRLVNHFSIVMSLSPNELSENLLLEVESLDSNNDFVNQIIKNVEMRQEYGKSL